MVRSGLSPDELSALSTASYRPESQPASSPPPVDPAVVSYARTKARTQILPEDLVVRCILALYGGPDVEVDGVSVRAVLSDQTPPGPFEAVLRLIAEGDFTGYQHASALLEAIYAGLYTPADDSTLGEALRGKLAVEEVRARRRLALAQPGDPQHSSAVLRERFTYDQRLEDALTWLSRMEPERLEAAMKETEDAAETE